MMTNKPELLAPAGHPEAAYAALHYGADAIYLGLTRFSARAEATNFTPNQLSTLTAHAHSLTPRRNVYLTLNTLLQQRDLTPALHSLETAADCNIDAVIVQDWGILLALKTLFPHIPIHASTQMAIHNLEGARMAKRLGCSRVTLARELTLNEITTIVNKAQIEVETFIHGTLCYAYSGLCLFSSMLTGRSGNRGKCVYSCREAVRNPHGPTHPFSLKDMALGPRILDLARAGVKSLKIEGRKKSPLYVAATVAYYRAILDGTLPPNEEQKQADRVKTIFARPWTTLFLDGRFNPHAVDTEVVGHRGAPLGKVEDVVHTPAGPGVALTPRLPLERHDGMQIDLPGQSRPYGFAVDNLYLFDGKKNRPVFAAPAGGRVAVALPPDAPPLTAGLTVCLSSSQEVKRSYPVPAPKAGGFGQLLPGNVMVSVLPGSTPKECRLVATALVQMPKYMNREHQNPEATVTSPEATVTSFVKENASRMLTASVEMSAACFPPRDPEGPRQAAEAAFARTGASRFRLNVAEFANDQGVFAKPGDWNRLRRDLLIRLEEAWQEARKAFREEISAAAAALAVPEHRNDPAGEPSRPSGEDEVFWSVCVQRIADLDAFSPDDFSDASEVIVTLEPDRCAEIDGELADLSRRCGRDKIRLALPVVMRPPQTEMLLGLVDRLGQGGWRKWFASNAGALEMLSGRDADITADWFLYTLNELSVRQLFLFGCRAATLSPEDDARNMASLLKRYSGSLWVVAYADVPLFISAACVHAHLGECIKGERESCPNRNRPLVVDMEKSGQVCIQAMGCGSVATGEAAFTLTERREILNDMGARLLRVDLRWRERKTSANLALWRSVVSGEIIPGRLGNFERGLH